jgi:hypothetical protein
MIPIIRVVDHPVSCGVEQVGKRFDALTGILPELRGPCLYYIRAFEGFGDFRFVLPFAMTQERPKPDQAGCVLVATKQDKHRLVGMSGGVAVKLAGIVLRAHVEAPQIRAGVLSEDPGNFGRHSDLQGSPVC